MNAEIEQATQEIINMCHELSNIKCSADDYKIALMDIFDSVGTLLDAAEEMPGGD